MFVRAGNTADFDMLRTPLNSIATDRNFIRIAKAIAHPLFAVRSTMDIAVAILDKSLVFSAKIQPICLPLPGENLRGQKKRCIHKRKIILLAIYFGKTFNVCQNK
jgi:hypothetical protein